jgi:hypothetical protein
MMIFLVAFFASLISLTTCCQCPQPPSHWETHHCDAPSALHKERWPYPYNGTCEIAIVNTCVINGVNQPITYTHKDLYPTGNTYHLLAIEYATSLLNTAEGSCIDHTKATDKLFSFAPVSEGRRASVYLGGGVMDRTRVLLNLHCGERSFSKIPPGNGQDEITWLIHALRGFNNGLLFTRSGEDEKYLCFMNGNTSLSQGSDRTFSADRCHGGCTMVAESWKKKNGSTPVCGSEETYSSLLESISRDPWMLLAKEYVAALLNSERACVPDTVAKEGIEKAHRTLMEDCPCSDPSLIGREGCSHVVPSSEERIEKFYTKTTSLLKEYNSGIIGPGMCDGTYHHNHNQYEDVIDAYLGDDKDASFCCVGGCTRGYAYYLSHSCYAWHGSSKYREAWPGSFDMDCSTLPNVEGDNHLCGRSYHSILFAYGANETVRGETDLWMRLAQAFIVAKLNENSGACTRSATHYYTQEKPWVRLSVAEVIVRADALLSYTCTSDHSKHVPIDGLSSSISDEMEAIIVVLEDFIQGNYGPGQCYPNMGTGGCNDLPVSLVDGNSTTTIVANSGERTSECALSKDTLCCTKTGNYWRRFNSEEPSPRNESKWPFLVSHVACDYEHGLCYPRPLRRGETKGTGELFERAVVEILGVNPSRIAPSYPFNRPQEHASYCPGPNYMATRMARLLKMTHSTPEKTMRQYYSKEQRMWIRLANAFTVAMLNAKAIFDGACTQSPDVVLRKITKLDSYGYLSQTDYIDRCLFGACSQESIPRLHGEECSRGYYSVVNALEQFSKGSVFGHCSVSEPPEHCSVDENGGYCSCVKPSSYYETHHTGHPLFSEEWPKVVDVGSFSFPTQYMPSSSVSMTEFFGALTCPTANGVSRATWLSLITEASPPGDPDSYRVLMRQLIAAWLNVFSGACMPSDVRDTLMEATHLVGSLTLTQGKNALCVSASLGTRVPVSRTSEVGAAFMSAARVLKSFNEGYQGSDMCENLCDEKAIDCGSHGMCDNGACVCERGYAGERCNFFDCNGNGLFVDEKCVCSVGWTGRNCDQCSPSPESFRGHVYVCVPCTEDMICNGGRGYLIVHMPMKNATDAIHENKAFLPGTEGLDCSCNTQKSFRWEAMKGGGGRRRGGDTGKKRSIVATKEIPSAVVLKKEEGTKDGGGGDVGIIKQQLGFCLESRSLSQVVTLKEQYHHLSARAPEDVTLSDLYDQENENNKEDKKFYISTLVIVGAILLAMAIIAVMVFLLLLASSNRSRVLRQQVARNNIKFRPHGNSVNFAPQK